MSDSIIRIILQAVDKASGTFKGVGDSAEKMGGQAQTAGQAMVASWKKILGATAVVGAAALAIKKAWDFSEEGARLLSLEVSYSKLAASANASSTEIVKSIQSASLNTISEYDAMQSASNALMLGLGADSDKLGNLAQIAALRGRAMGLSTTQAFNDMVRGIGRMSPMILDNLGIVIDAEGTYSKYAASVGKAANELTSFEKRQALLNKVLEEGNKMLADAGGLVADAATGVGRATAALADFSNTWKTNWGRSVGSMFLTKDERIKAWNEESQAVIQTARNYQEYQAEVARLGVGWGLLPGGSLKIPEGYADQFLSEFAANEAIYFQGLAEAYKNVPSNINTSTKAAKDFNEELALQAGLSNEIANIQEKYQATIEKYGKNSEKTTAAIKEMSEATSQFIYDLVNANDSIELSASMNLELANNLGLIDTKSLLASKALDLINRKYDKNADGIIQAEEATQNYISDVTTLNNNANELMKDRSATWSISILVNGISMSQFGFGGSVSSKMLSEFNKSSQARQFHWRASGGPVQMGQPYIVGESGPEVMVPNSNGTVIPNNKLTGSNSVKIYGNPTFVLGRDGVSASDILEQVSVA